MDDWVVKINRHCKGNLSKIINRLYRTYLVNAFKYIENIHIYNLKLHNSENNISYLVLFYIFIQLFNHCFFGVGA